LKAALNALERRGHIDEVDELGDSWGWMVASGVIE